VVALKRQIETAEKLQDRVKKAFHAKVRPCCRSLL
jgi:hypothetical protein